MKEEKRQIGFGDWYCPKDLKKYLNQIIKSRRLTYGPFCQKLEEKFAQCNGTKFNNFCSSGTAALYTAIGTLKNLFPERAKERKAIVLPATTFISDFNCVIANGFYPVFVDIAANYNIAMTDLDNILRAHHRDVFAVIPSSLFGRPVNCKRIRDMVNSYCKDAFIVLDSCETICSQYGNEYPEAYADFTAWSFYVSHLLIGGACGGMLGTNNERLAVHARSFINHGRQSEYVSIDDDDNLADAKLKDITAKRFQFVQHGLNFRLGEVEAAFALAMLEDGFEDALKKRENNALKLLNALREFELRLPSVNDVEQNRWMMFPIEIVKGDKWDLIQHLEKRGIETRELLPMYQKITEPYFENLTKFRTDFPASARAYDNGFYVGCHHYMTDEDISFIAQAFKDYYKK